MAISDSIKDELIHTEVTKECCAKAEICAAILLSGGIGFRGFTHYALSITVTKPGISRYYFTLIKKYLGVTVEIRTSISDGKVQRTKYELVFPDDCVDEVMEQLRLKDENALFGIASRPHESITKEDHCGASFLKSAFLITGSMSDPDKEYALTIGSAGEEMAQVLTDLMRSRGIRASMSTRRSHFVTYIKNAEGISAMLAVIGAHSAMLNLENIRIVKDMRNSSNRQTNCDNNNINRTVASANGQMEAIRFLAEKVGIENLPDWAREIASLRLENPDASLTELSELCDPPIGKSGVNNRLRRLMQLAQKYTEDEQA